MNSIKEIKSITHTDEILKRIANRLILETCTFPELSLYHGKMGILLFFVHYARYTDNPIYEDFAGKLLDEIFEEINDGLPINFEFGLCGIGWGIEYLLQNGFMEEDSDEILHELDLKIMERDLRYIQDKSIQTGLEGISYYIHKRIHSPGRLARNTLLNRQYLDEWKNIQKDTHIPDDQELLLNIYGNGTAGNLIEWKLGLENGCAGYGLKLLLK
ncbi:MAG: hypothetical protein LUG51_10820 [Tannerellaceae bacterium]|nr:hypothetical protein [Tannerellaceae bacterium]